MEEAWLSGPIENISPLLMPAAHALRQAAVDIEKITENLTTERIWSNISGAPSVGFHLLHIAGSIDRLLTYCRDEKLNERQFAELAEETKTNNALDIETLKRRTLDRIEKAIEVLASTPEQNLLEKRFVGRKQLRTNVFGLLFHIAEHTQRHVGQIVATAKTVKPKK